MIAWTEMSWSWVQKQSDLAINSLKEVSMCESDMSLDHWYFSKFPIPKNENNHVIQLKNTK